MPSVCPLNHRRSTAAVCQHPRPCPGFLAGRRPRVSPAGKAGGPSDGLRKIVNTRSIKTVGAVTGKSHSARSGNTSPRRGLKVPAPLVPRIERAPPQPHQGLRHMPCRHGEQILQGQGTVLKRRGRGDEQGRGTRIQFGEGFPKPGNPQNRLVSHTGRPAYADRINPKILVRCQFINSPRRWPNLLTVPTLVQTLSAAA